MKLFEMKNWELIVSEEAWGLSPFQKILKRDKTKSKTRAHAEMLFIWFWCDIKSNYLLMGEKEREKELIHDIDGLPKGWKKDKLIDEAIKFYNKFETVIGRLYKQALKSAYDVGDYLEDTAGLLNERDIHDKPVIKISDITRSLKDINIIIKELKKTEQEVLKERESHEGKTKGSKQFNMYEQGI